MENMNDIYNENRRLETKRILIFICTTFLLTYGFSFLIVYPLVNNSDKNQIFAILSQLSVVALMFIPAIGVLITRLITKEGFKNSWLRPNFKHKVKYYIMAYFGPCILTLLGTLLYFLIFPKDFDPSLSYLKKVVTMTGGQNVALPFPIEILFLIQIIQAIFFAPMLNFIPCFGEEWGWRGYLLPKMAEKLPFVPTVIINGVIWGLWHAPIIALGHNYGIGYFGFPFSGILAMCIFCIIMGTLLSYLTLKTKNCIPAILAHGSINGIASIGIYFTLTGGNPFIGPMPTGLIGGLPFILAAILVIVIMNIKKED